MTKFRKNHEVGKTISLKTIIQIVFSIAIILTFFIVPFLHNIINDIVAQIAWYFSFAYIIFTSIETRIKTEKPIFENEYFEFIYNWGERFLLFSILSIFVFNYYNFDYIWHWVIFVSIALCTPAFTLSLITLAIKEKTRN